MKIKNILSVLLCGAFILALAAWCFFGPKADYSESERRTLAKFPEITWESISSGEFATDFEKYATDAFPLRDMWRSIKAYTRLGLFNQKDNNDLFLKDGHIGKLEYPMKPNMMDYAANLFTKVKEENFPNANVYFAMIPDKNKDLADLKLDYAEFETQMQEKLPFATPIQISDLLTAEDYYYTDTHWRQDRITDVADRLAQAMGTELPQNYEKQELDVDFYGVYAGQSAMNPDPDTITVLTNETIEGLKVQLLDLNTGALKSSVVYDMKKANGKDPYELFLSGNQAYVRITNPANTDGKRLIIFRDSFGSSITPLLAQGYSEVILLDLRYVSSVFIGKLGINFQNADVLFMYSTLLLNNSTGMK